MLRNWKRAKTVLTFFRFLTDVRVDHEVRIVGLDGLRVVTERVRGKPTRLSFDLTGALFDRVLPDELPGELLSMTPEEVKVFSLFLLVRLAADGGRLCLATRIPVN
jgi:hypothetical protein